MGILLSDVMASLERESAGRDFLVISGSVSRDLHKRLTEVLASDKRNNKCTLFFTTFGGDPHGGYRIARCLRHNYEHLRVVVPSYCKSAGTLIAICADEIALGDLGELGPLDVQVSKPTELMENSSGLDIMQALQVVRQHAQEVFRQSLMDIRMGGRLTTKMAGEFASKLATGVVGPLYSQIDPNRIGEMQRAMRIASEYGKRLDRYASNLKPGALEKLLMGYPSHSFVIDRKEAKELFKSVYPLTEAENALCRYLSDALSAEKDFGPQLMKSTDSGVTEGIDHEESQNKEGKDDKSDGSRSVQAGRATNKRAAKKSNARGI